MAYGLLPRPPRRTCGALDQGDVTTSRRDLAADLLQVQYDEIMKAISRCTLTELERRVAKPPAAHSPAPLHGGLSGHAKTRKVAGRISTDRKSTRLNSSHVAI